MKSALFKSAIAIALFLGAAGGSWWMVAAQGVPNAGGIPSSGGPAQAGRKIVPAGGMPGAGAGMMNPDSGMPTANSKWKYEFFIINHPLSQTDVVNLLNKRESEGWEFVSVMQVKADAVGLGAGGGVPGGSLGGRGLGAGGGESGAGEGTLNTAYVFRRPNNILNAGGGSMMGGPGGIGPAGTGSGLPGRGGMGGPVGGQPGDGPGIGAPGGMGMRGGPPGAGAPGGEGSSVPGGPPGMGFGGPGLGGGPSAPIVSEAEVHQQLRGKWELINAETPLTVKTSSKVIIFQDKKTVLVDGKTASYFVNPFKSPNELTIASNDLLAQCIYSLNDGKLTIACFESGREVDRPKTFEPSRLPSKQRLIVATYQRQPEGK